MTEGQAAVLQSVMDVLFDKETSNMHPSHALSIEVARLTGMTLREVERQAEALKSEGLIRIGRTLNYSYYELTKKN